MENLLKKIFEKNCIAHSLNDNSQIQLPDTLLLAFEGMPNLEPNTIIEVCTEILQLLDSSVKGCASNFYKTQI
jgi:hypothetical protein